MGNPITLQTICTFCPLADAISFPPSYFSPGAFGGKFPVGSANGLFFIIGRNPVNQRLKIQRTKHPKCWKDTLLNCLNFVK